MAEEYLHLNRANWDERAPEHAADADFSFQEFLSDPKFLSWIVWFDRP